MTTVFDQNMNSDSDDEDFDPNIVVEGQESEESDDELQTKSTANEIPFIDDKILNKRKQENWNSFKESVKDNKKHERNGSILEFYKNMENKNTLQNYEFAGEKFSAYAKDVLDVQIKPGASNETTSILKVENTPVKSTARKQKPSRLNQLALKYGVAENIRLNTLEKSKLDWNKFVDEEGIREELKQKNKDGYLERIAFLQRTDDRQETLIKHNLVQKKH